MVDTMVDYEKIIKEREQISKRIIFGKDYDFKKGSLSGEKKSE